MWKKTIKNLYNNSITYILNLTSIFLSNQDDSIYIKNLKLVFIDIIFF